MLQSYHHTLIFILSILFVGIQSVHATTNYKQVVFYHNSIVEANVKYDNQSAILQVLVHLPKITAVTPHQQAEDEKVTSLEFVILAESIDKDVDSLPNCKANSLRQQSHMFVQLNCRPDLSVNESLLPLKSSAGKEFCLSLDAAKNISVEFSHMYTADYCLVIIPRTLTGSRKPLNMIFRLFSFLQPVDVSRWQTTMDLQPMHYRRSISVGFTQPDSMFEFGSDFRVDLLQVNNDRCNDTEDYLHSWSMIVSMKNLNQSAFEFIDRTPGYYCAVVTPVDERCEGHNLWMKHEDSCSRHSFNPVHLKDLYLNETGSQPTFNNQQSVDRISSAELWTIISIICGFSFLLLGVSITFLGHRYMQLKKRKRLLLSDLSNQIGSTPNVYVNSIGQMVPNLKICDTSGNLEPRKLVSRNQDLQVCEESAQILLLYRRDDVKTKNHVAALHYKLKEMNFQVYDYGDEAQWEEIATEGVEWLPNRIRTATRVVVVHSNTKTISISSEEESDQEKQGERGRLLKVYNSSELVGIDDSMIMPNGDPDFIFGMQLLQCNLTAWHQQVYQRVLNVRFVDTEQNFSKESHHPIAAPFTLFLLPAHLNQFFHHLKS